MAFDVRPLRAKIGLQRPDLDHTAQLRFCVDEAVREVCRRTFLARYFQSGTTLTIGDPNVTVDIGANRELLKIHNLEMLNLDDGNYYPLEPVSYVLMKGHPDEVGIGTPSRFSQQGPLVRVYPVPVETRTIRLEASYVPNDQPNTAPLPEIAMQAVETRAEAMALSIPGPYQDKHESAIKEAYHRRLIGNLKGISDFGEVGEIMMATPRIPGVR